MRRDVYIIYQCTLSYNINKYFDKILQNALALTAILLFGLTILFYFYSSYVTNS